jgi:hypothetical protein
MAGATFLVANLAAFRSERHETEELYEGLVATRGERTIGHLASVAWAMAAAAVVVLVEGAYLLVLRPVGLPNVFEVTTGLATVGLMGALGILLGRYVRSAVAAPVALVALASVWALISLHTEQASTPYKWLTPWVLAPTNPELLVRPAALHLLYLVSLITLVGAVAVLRDGRRRARAIAIAAAMAVMVSGWAVTRPPSDAARAAIARLVQKPARFEECATLEGVRYCAYPGYRGWIGRWNAVVRSTRDPAAS